MKAFLTAAAMVLGLTLILTSCSSCTTRAPGSTTEVDFARRYVDYHYCKVPLTKQPSQKSCGAAVLASLINYWREDTPTTVGYLIRAYPAESKNGYPLLQLKEMALEEEILAFALSMERDPLQQMLEHVSKGRPVIAALDLPKGRYFGGDLPLIETLDRRTVSGLGDKTKAHYVIVMGASHDRVLLMDPQYGYVDTTQREFEQYWKAMGYPALICSEKPKGVKVR